VSVIGPRALAIAGALAAGAILAAGAPGSPSQAAATLPIDASFAVEWRGVAGCPPGTPAGLSCYEFAGEALVPGLGRVTARYTKTFDGNLSGGCIHTLATAGVAVDGRGEITLSMIGPACELLPPALSLFDATITGGSGPYAGASGSVRISSSVSERGAGEGIAVDRWSGTLTVPGREFDLTAPTLEGAVSKTVRAPKKAKRMRVRYTVTAHDTADGPVPVACAPRSGGFFKPGRTRVRCSATDSSANTGRAEFTITVRRTRA
jgi:HYR domain